MKPAFRNAFKKGRCLIVADGFYKWKKTGSTKQPFFVRLKTTNHLPLPVFQNNGIEASR